MHGLDYFCTIYKYKLKELADYLGIKQPSINSWKTGIKNIPDRHKKKIAELFQVPEDKIYLISKENLDDLDKVEIELIFSTNCLENAIVDGSRLILPQLKMDVLLLKRQKEMYELLNEIKAELISSAIDFSSDEFDRKIKELKSIVDEFKNKQMEEL